MHTPSQPDKLSLLRQAVCDNQGAYIQYSYMGHELHRRLKDAPNATAGIIRSYVHSLTDFLDKRLLDVLCQNAFALYELFLFSRPHQPPPRICIKTNVKAPDGRTLISDLFRLDYEHPKVPFPIYDNTGFMRVAESGVAYYQPDIPRAAAEGTYINSRLILENVATYRSPSRFPTVLFGGKRDLEWEKCWLPYEAGGELPPESCYKSTLIVPITFWNNDLDAAFLEHVENRLRSIYVDQPSEGFDRLIFAYLCLDHVEANYFSGDKWENLGYIFADLMSLFFFRRWTLTAASSAYQRARDHIAEAIGAGEEVT